jgi:very-short-patch-repair endonuclease
MGEVAAQRRVGVFEEATMPKLDRFRITSARRLRAAMTDEERILWHHLWRIPVEGTHFRKQAPIGPFYADFVSHRLKLVVELDGGHHAQNVQKDHDDRRTAWLEENGYRVIRFWNGEVRKELESVLDTIYAAVEERRSLAADHPTPALSRRPSPSRGG